MLRLRRSDLCHHPSRPAEAGREMGSLDRHDTGDRNPSAHQVLRQDARDRGRRHRGRYRRGVRLPRPQRRRQVDDDPAAARLHPPDERIAQCPRHGLRNRLDRDPPPGRVRAGRPLDVREDDGPRDVAVLRVAARNDRHRDRGCAGRAAQAGPRSQDPLLQHGQPPEGGSGAGVHARAGAADPRRADERPRPADPAGVLRPHPRNQR